MIQSEAMTPRRAGKYPAGPIDDAAEALRERLSTVVDQLVEMASGPTVTEALAARTHLSSLGLLMDHMLQEHPDLQVMDEEISRLLEVARTRRGLLERAGGACDTSEAAELLGITPEAVRKRIERGTLLSYRTPSGEHRLPRFQFTENGTLEGLADVLRAMHVEAPWMRIQLMLDRDVLSALNEGRVADAVRSVDGYLPKDEGEA